MLRDFAQALSDLGLVLVLTFLLLVVLFLAGWWLRRRARKLHIKASRIASHTNNPTDQEQSARISYSATFWQGMSTELFGAAITTLAFGVVVLIFQQYQSVQNHKAELVLQMGSPDNAFAIEAVRQLKVLDWLRDGTLQRVSLSRANLQGANLTHANIRGADFEDANLTYVTFCGADLQSANLRAANLQSANLNYTNLRGSFLVNANLQGAYLRHADLQSANSINANLQNVNLLNANLQGVDLRYAQLQDAYLVNAYLQSARLDHAVFSETTILPDGSMWTSVTDMTHFTDPSHPDFWQPEWVRGQSSQLSAARSSSTTDSYALFPPTVMLCFAAH